MSSGSANRTFPGCRGNEEKTSLKHYPGDTAHRLLQILIANLSSFIYNSLVAPLNLAAHWICRGYSDWFSLKYLADRLT